MRVDPPTRMTSSSWPAFIFASSSACWNGFCLLERLLDPLHQIRAELFELGTRERDVEVLRLVIDRSDIGQVDLGTHLRTQFDLRALGRFAKTLESVLLLEQVNALVLLELLGEPVDDLLVVIVTAEVTVTGGRFNLEDAVSDVENRHVERPAAEVEDENRLILLLVEAIGERGRGRLVDDPLDLEAGDLPGVLGGLPLTVVEVGGDGDDGLVDRFAKVGLGVSLQLLEDHRADLLRGEVLVDRRDVDDRHSLLVLLHLVADALGLRLDLRELVTHEPLDAAHRVLRVDHRLPLGGHADKALAVVLESDDARERARSFGRRNDDRLAPLHHGHDRVGRAEVDAYCSAHEILSSSVTLSVIRSSYLSPLRSM